MSWSCPFGFYSTFLLVCRFHDPLSPMRESMLTFPICMNFIAPTSFAFARRCLYLKPTPHSGGLRSAKSHQPSSPTQLSDSSKDTPRSSAGCIRRVSRRPEQQRILLNPLDCDWFKLLPVQLEALPLWPAVSALNSSKCAEQRLGRLHLLLRATTVVHQSTCSLLVLHKSILLFLVLKIHSTGYNEIFTKLIATLLTIGENLSQRWASQMTCLLSVRWMQFTLLHPKWWRYLIAPMHLCFTSSASSHLFAVVRRKENTLLGEQQAETQKSKVQNIPAGSQTNTNNVK